MMALIHSSRRLLVAVCAVGLAVSSAPACQTVPPPVPPGKLEAARLELERLKRDTLKVDKSIAVTKDLINRSKGERYLPDLYFRLSELYIEKSRLVYFRVLEEAGAEDKSAVVAPEARLLKDQAIAVYRRILSEFPDYIDNDKITFFIAHEYRELGNFPEMIKTYVELVKKFPRSNFRFESWLILGDYYFDKGDVDEAMSNYRSILKNQETYAHNMARYKLAWCYINKDKPILAVDLWEQAVKTPTVPDPGSPAIDPLSSKPARLDVRQDALRDLAFYYAEVRDPKSALAFFQNLTVSRSEYRVALEKLARRFQIKTMYDESAKVYRELIRISHDVERNLEWAEAVYEAAVASKDLNTADEDVAMLAEVAARYKYWWRTPNADKKILDDFELLTRDLSTRLHALAKEKGSDDLYRRAARAYDRYLSVFPDSPERLNIEWNYAETLFAGKDFVKAGRQYETVLKLLSAAPVAAPGDGAPRAAPPPAATQPAMSTPASPDGKNAAAVKAVARDGAVAPVPVGGQRLVATTGSVDGDTRQAMYSAILSYFEALKTGEKATRFESMMAREGIKALGARFVSSWPADENVPQVKFNVARAYFEQGIFDRSIELFAAFVTEHPTHKDAITAAELALDAYAQQEDFSGLAKQARAFASDTRVDASFRERASTMADQAEQEEINRRTIAAEGRVAEAIASFVVEKKGTEVAAKALHQAFVIAKDRRNLADMQSVGRQLVEEYANTKYALEVLPALADLAVRTSQLETAASYYEEQARRFPNDSASDAILESAAAIRTELSEYPAAMADYERLTKQGDENRRGEYFEKLARLALRAGDFRRAETAALSAAETPASAVVANVIAGEAALRTGKPEQAVERLSTALGKKASGDDGEVWQARAQYLIGEVVRAEFERVSLTGGTQDGETLARKFELLEELEGAYVAAIQIGDPEWAMGGLYRIANAYKDAADFLDTAPVPAGTSPEDEKALRTALAERSTPMRKKYVETIESCKAQAKKLEAFNRFSRACFGGTPVDDNGDSPRARLPGLVIPGREALEQKLVDNPKDVATLTQLIRSAISVRDFSLARLLSLRALELDEKNAEILNLLGVASFQSNFGQAAAAAFKKSLKVNAKYGPAQANLGVVWTTYGDVDKGRDLMAKSGVVEVTSPDILPQVRSMGGGR
jgi:tetratricopeptide (TPR) repeat protein